MTTNIQILNIPDIVFIVPYRNRPQHKFFFEKYINSILSKDLNYEVYFSHQTDTRAFNRGATKNIGFIAMKHKYPNNYKTITFVFNDIDTMPFSDIFDFATKIGEVKHFYGFVYALGGIMSITGHDFELINGFPNYWGWGMEDTVLQHRCTKHNLYINRDNFYPIGSPEILHLFDGITRIVNSQHDLIMKKDDGLTGLNTIFNLKYKISVKSCNVLDNIHTNIFENIKIINILQFTTDVPFQINNCRVYDIRQPTEHILKFSKQHINGHNINESHINGNDWTCIPLYPNSQQTSQLIAKHGTKKANEIIKQNYIKSSTKF